MSTSPGVSGEAFADRPVSLHEHMDMCFELRDKATDLAREAMDAKLERLNELRATVSTVVASCPTNAQLGMLKEGLEDKVRGVVGELRGEMVSSHDFRIAHEATAKQSGVNLALGLSLLSAGISIVLLVMRVMGK